MLRRCFTMVDFDFVDARLPCSDISSRIQPDNRSFALGASSTCQVCDISCTCLNPNSRYVEPSTIKCTFRCAAQHVTCQPNIMLLRTFLYPTFFSDLKFLS